jgi:hypothetical protein
VREVTAIPERLDDTNKSSSMPEETSSKTTPKKPRKRKAKLPPALVWCRSISLISILAGGFGMMRPQFFWFSVSFVYVGLFLVSVDLYFEPDLTPRFKAVGESVVMAGLIGFSHWFVFVSAPLNFSSLASNINYSNGATPGGIAWRPFFTELDLMVSNPTDGNYDDVDIWIRPDSPVAAIAQLSNLSDVSFEDYYGATSRVTAEDLSTNVAVPLVFLATDAGYKVHCGRIPPKSSLRIVMAVVDIKKSKPQVPQAPITVPRDISPDDFFVVWSFDTKGDKSFYWYGSAKNTSIFAPRAEPKKVTIKGSFTATNRRRSVNHETIVL